MPSEDESRLSTGCTNRPALANPNVVSSPPTTLCEQPWILLPRPDLLQQPSRSGPHPLHRSLHLMVCPVSGDPSAVSTFQRRLLTFSWHLGGQALKNSMPHTLKNGWHFVVKGKLIIIHHHWAMPFNFSRGYFVKGLATQPLILLALPCLPLLR